MASNKASEAIHGDTEEFWSHVWKRNYDFEAIIHLSKSMMVVLHLDAGKTPNFGLIYLYAIGKIEHPGGLNRNFRDSRVVSEAIFLLSTV